MDFINPITGELIVGLDQQTDEVIIKQIRELDRYNSEVYCALKTLKGLIIRRMVMEGAKLKLTEVGKVRLQYTSQVKDKTLVEALFRETPETMRSKCFGIEYKPKKAGLNELAKLGTVWAGKVDGLYEQIPSLKIEYEGE